MSTSPYPRLVALSGHAQSGKDTFAAMLSEFGYQRLALADPLREGLYALNPIVQGDHQTKPFRVQEIVDDIGWEEAKRMPGGEIRGLLQRMGTEFGRTVFGPDIWVETLLEKVWKGPRDQRYVITDCRFPNEAQLLGEEGAVIVRVNRPGVRPVNDHPSDAGLPEELVDYDIQNDGDLHDLWLKAEKFMSAWTASWKP